MSTLHFVDFEQSVKSYYENFFEIHYSYNEAMLIIDDAILNSNSFDSIFQCIDEATDITSNYCREIKLFNNSMEQLYLIAKEYANEAKRKNIKLLEHPTLYEIYQNLCNLKKLLATVSGSSLYAEYSFTKYINKAKLQQYKIANIELKRNYYLIEKNIIELILMYEV